MKKRTLIIVLSVLVVVLLGCLSYIFDWPFYARYIEPSQNNDTEPENNLTPDTPSKTGGKYDIKYNSEEREICGLYPDENKCDKIIATIDTEEEEIEILDTYEDKYFFFKDNNKVKVYNNNDKKVYLINVDASDTIHMYFAVDYHTDNLYGVIYNGEEENYFYSVKTNRIMYKNKYTDLVGLSEDYIYTSVFESDQESSVQTKLIVLSTKEEKEVFIKDVRSFTDGGSEVGLTDVSKGNKRYYLLAEGMGYAGYNEYYNESFEPIYTTPSGTKPYNEDKFLYDTTIGKDDNIYVYNNGYLTSYDYTGKEIKKSEKLENVEMIVDEYAVVTNNNLSMVDINGKEIVVAPWKKGNYLHTMLSGWYETGGKEGYYFVVEEEVDPDKLWEECKNNKLCPATSREELSDNGVGYEYYYIPSTKETGKIPTYIGGYAKPILYLYPEKETTVTVTFDKPNNLTTTYPKYKDSWVVTAHPNGDLYDKNNKYYYGLYWEENLNHRVNFNEGFYVESDDAIEFLESKLSYIGLNDKERNEFIMYWLPILERNGKNLVYFELTKERDSYSKLNITPKVDSILRLAIHVKKVNNKVNIKEQKLTTFNRVGFTAVEWGGVIY